MNLELGKLKAALQEATEACGDGDIRIVEFTLYENAAVGQPYSRTIEVKYLVKEK